MERYQRQIMLDNFGEEGQLRLKKSSALIVGIGGLGSVISLYLTAAGIGRLGLIDSDVVSITNLQRQILYREEELGQCKVDCASNTLKRLNREVAIETYFENLTEANAIDIISNYDIIIDGTDNFISRYLINDVCVGLNKPYFFGSLAEYSGQISIFNTNENSATYRCLFPECKDEANEERKVLGVLGTTASVTASLQTNEVIKWITGYGETLSDKLLTFDLRDPSFSTLNLTPTTEGREKSLDQFRRIKLYSSK